MKIVEYNKNWEHAKYLWIKQNFLGASVKILLTILQLNFIIFEQPKTNIICKLESIGRYSVRPYTAMTKQNVQFNQLRR